MSTNSITGAFFFLFFVFIFIIFLSYLILPFKIIGIIGIFTATNAGTLVQKIQESLLLAPLRIAILPEGGASAKAL
jgi:hypothetical protein